MGYFYLIQHCLSNEKSEDELKPVLVSVHVLVYLAIQLVGTTVHVIVYIYVRVAERWDPEIQDSTEQ